MKRLSVNVGEYDRAFRVVNTAMSKVVDEKEEYDVELNVSGVHVEETVDLLVSKLPSKPNLHIISMRVEAHGNLINKLPIAVCKWIQLEKMELQGNQLTQLPVEFGQLQLLRYLNLNDNSFVEIPRVICVLKQLEWLSVSYNQLTDQSFPAEMCQLADTLRHLELRFNMLTHLPQVVCQLILLEWLDVSSNQLTALHADFPKLIHLKHLNITKNPLRCVPQGEKLLEELLVDGKCCVLRYLLLHGKR